MHLDSFEYLLCKLNLEISILKYKEQKVKTL